MKIHTQNNNYEISKYTESEIFHKKETIWKYIQMHTKNEDQICDCLSTGILEEDGKAIPSNDEATNF